MQKDLMLGNYLQDSISKTILEVIEISANGFSTYVIDRSKFPLKQGWQAERIPLTQKWIIDFKLDKIAFFEIFGDDKRGFHISSEFGEWIMLEYVDQLQKLVYSLTGIHLQLVE